MRALQYLRRRSLYLCASGGAALLAAGCTAGMVTSSLYQGPKSGSTSSVRFHVVSYARGPFFNSMGVYVFGDEQCSESEFGRYVGEMGRDKLFVSTKENSIGMPKPAGYQEFAYVERTFRADRPVVFSIRASTDGPGAICRQSYVFTPVSGEMYEIQFAINGYERCDARILAVNPAKGDLTPLPPGTLRRLPKYCSSNSLLN